MYYFRATLALHDDESVIYAGAAPVQEQRFGERSGNGGHEVELAAWSPLPFVAVVTGHYDYGQRIEQRAVHAESLPHTLREVEADDVDALGLGERCAADTKLAERIGL